MATFRVGEQVKIVGPDHLDNARMKRSIGTIMRKDRDPFDARRYLYWVEGDRGMGWFSSNSLTRPASE